MTHLCFWHTAPLAQKQEWCELVSVSYLENIVEVSVFEYTINFPAIVHIQRSEFQSIFINLHMR